MKDVLGTTNDWPLLFSLIVVPAVLQVVTMPFCKESPRYLSSKGQDQSAIEGKIRNQMISLYAAIPTYYMYAAYPYI